MQNWPQMSVQKNSPNLDHQSLLHTVRLPLAGTPQLCTCLENHASYRFNSTHIYPEPFEVEAFCRYFRGSKAAKKTKPPLTRRLDFLGWGENARNISNLIQKEFCKCFCEDQKQTYKTAKRLEIDRSGSCLGIVGQFCTVHLNNWVDFKPFALCFLVAVIKWDAVVSAPRSVYLWSKIFKILRVSS